jgi:sugar phosphate isomerase/epimerase
MAKTVFHASIEGAQHGAKSLEELVIFAKESGAAGAEPSNYHVEDGKGGFKSAAEIRAVFDKHDMKLDGISCHCPIWCHTTAWTGSKTIRPFLPKEVWEKSPEEIEAWLEDYILKFMDLSAELGLKIIPMFWGMSHGFEVATGYPFGFFEGPEYDLIAEGNERFATKTAKIRQKANDLGIYLCHEIHPNSAALCADDFNMLVDACDGDPCLGVTADPSHCWEGEDFETRFRKVGDRIYAAAIKNFTIRKGVNLRSMTGDWRKRAMQFCDIPTGDMNMMRFTELLIDLGYADRYCEIMGTETAPLVTEAESAYRDLDATSANAIKYAADHLVFPIAEGSFEDGMGAED